MEEVVGKMGKEGQKRKENDTCVEGKKREGYVCGGEKKRGKKKEIWMKKKVKK